MRNIQRFSTLFLLLFVAGSLHADFPIATTVFHDVFPAVAYNSTNDEYLVVWSCMVPYNGIVIPWAGFVLGQRVDASGSLINGPFIIIANWCVINVSVAYNSGENDYMVAAAYGIPPEIYCQRVSHSGTLIDTPKVVLSDVVKPRILYNPLADNYLIVGAGWGTGAGISTRVISPAADPVTAAVRATDTDTTHYSYYDIAYAPIVSTETPYGRYILDRDGTNWFSMLDSYGNPIITWFDGALPLDAWIPFPIRTSSIYTASLAYGAPSGVDEFAVAWSGAGTYSSVAWPGIWAGYVYADYLDYDASTAYPENGFPVSYIYQDAFYAYYVREWMPTVCYNAPTGLFFAVWREMPVAGPSSEVQVNHIRGDWLEHHGLKPTSANYVLSSINGGEDPKYPVLASSTNSGKVLVVWNDMRNSATDSTDIYGTIFDLEAALPITLTSFTASRISSWKIIVEWHTASEVNNYGFEVQRRLSQDTVFQAIPGAFVPGNGTTNVAHSYAYCDSTAGSGVWVYRLKQIDLDGSFRYSEGCSASGANGIQQAATPGKFALAQNFPNPFNPTTTIAYEVPKAVHVNLTVYDILGREVAVLVDENKAANFYTVRFNAGGLASGVYVCRMHAGDFAQTRRMVVVR